MRWNTTKTNHGHNFQYTKLTDTWPKSACGKSSSCGFSFSAARKIPPPKLLNTYFSVFFFSVSWFSSLSSKSLNITVCKTVKASPLFHQADRLVRNASDVSAADWRYQTQVKKYDIFLCAFTAFLRARNISITP